MLAGDDMAKYSICGHPDNDEPSMRTCLESVAGWGVELGVVDFHGTDRMGLILLRHQESRRLRYSIRSVIGH
jgi:hypothetical protein